MASRPPPRLPDLYQVGAFLKALGLRFDVVEPTRVAGTMVLGPEHHTPWGVVHGGVYTTAIESVASVGASLAVIERGQFAVGLNNNTDFLRPLAGGEVRVSAEAVHQGQTQQLWQVTITRSDGKLVARGQVRLQNVDLPQGGASPMKPAAG